MAANWARKLPHAVETRDGKSYRTLAQARVLILKQRERNEWKAAAGAVLTAAETGTAGDLVEAERLLRNALFLDGLRLKL
jgi:hypothetical protein